MLAFCCLAIGWAAPTAPVFAPAVPWALNFAAPPRIPLVGDVNADGLADLLCVYPEGDCIIDVSLNVEGQKPSFGFQARTGWGKNCQAAVSGDFDGDGKADVLGLFDGSELVLAGDFGDRKFRSNEPWASLPKKVSGPEMSWLQAGEVLLVRSRGAEEGFTIRLKDRKVSRVRLPKGAWFAGPSEALPGGDGAFRPGWLLELGGTLRYEGRELARLNPVPATGRPTAQGTLAAIGGSVFDSSKPDAGQPIPLVSNLPASPSHYFFADMDEFPNATGTTLEAQGELLVTTSAALVVTGVTGAKADLEVAVTVTAGGITFTCDMTLSAASQRSERGAIQKYSVTLRGRAAPSAPTGTASIFSIGVASGQDAIISLVSNTGGNQFGIGANTVDALITSGRLTFSDGAIITEDYEFAVQGALSGSHVAAS